MRTLRQQAHGVGGSHHAAGSAAGRTGVNQLFKLLLGQFALFHFGDASADIDRRLCASQPGPAGE